MLDRVRGRPFTFLNYRIDIYRRFFSFVNRQNKKKYYKNCLYIFFQDFKGFFRGFMVCDFFQI